MSALSPLKSGLILSAIALTLIIAFVISRPKGEAPASEPTAPISTAPLPSKPQGNPVEQGDVILDQIEAGNHLEPQARLAKEHLLTLAPSPQAAIAWLAELNQHVLGKDHQQWPGFIRDHQLSQLPFISRNGPFDQTLPFKPIQDKSDPDELLQETQDREMRIAKVKFLVDLYRILLEDKKTVFPTAQVLPSLGSNFSQLLEADQETTIKEKLAHAMGSLDDFCIRQLLALEEISSPHHREVICKIDGGWLLPLALKSPTTAGSLAGHLLPRSSLSNDPYNSAYTIVRNIGREIEKQNDLRALAHFLGHFLKESPGFGIRLEGGHEEIIEEAWKNHFKRILSSQTNSNQPDWDQVYQEAFLIPASQLDHDERAVLAFGLTSFLYSHFDTFPYSSQDKKSIPPRIAMKKKLASLLSPYPEFQSCVFATHTNLRHDFIAENQIPADQLQAFLLDQNQPFYLRLQIAKRALQLRFLKQEELEKLAPALASIVCEFSTKGYSGKETDAIHILIFIRKQAESSPKATVWQKQCARISQSWLQAIFVPGSIYRDNSNSALNELMTCGLASGDREIISKILSDHNLSMQGNFALIEKLMLSGSISQAASLCRNFVTANRHFHHSLFTADLEQALPTLLAKVTNPANRFIVESHLAGKDDSFEENPPTTTRISRLRDLALRFPEIAFPTTRTETACLSILCSEPSIAWLLKDELAQKVGDLEVVQFKKRGPLFEERGLGTFSDMLLYNAHLGNLARVGKQETLETTVRELIALTNEGLDHGAWMLGDLLRVLYDHFLVMAKDGRTQEIATYRELTRDIYHLMMTHHKGWNYRSQSLAITVFCHAAAKQFDQLLPWAKKNGGDLSEHYQKYHSRLKSRWSPRQNPLTNLAIFWDLRGRFDTPELAPHRRAATLILMEDPALLRDATHPDFLTHCAKFNVNGSKVLTFADVIAILDTWKERHPEHPGWPTEYAIAIDELKKQ